MSVDAREVTPSEVSEVDELGQTILHLFALGVIGDVPDPAPYIMLLAADGEDVDAKNYVGQTALHLAAFEGRLDIVQALIDAGAQLDLDDRINEDDQPGRTAAQYAVMNNHLEVVEALADAGANLKAGITAPLQIAEQLGFEPIASYLRDQISQ